MVKKILLSLAALVAFAAVPAAASASPILEDHAGNDTAVGTAIKATNLGNTILTSGFGNVTCSTSTLEGKVTANETGNVKGAIEKASFTGTATNGRCVSTIFGVASAQVTVENLPYELQATAADKWDITDPVGLRFTFDLFNSSNASVGSCTFERKAAEGGFQAVHASGRSTEQPGSEARRGADDHGSA